MIQYLIGEHLVWIAGAGAILVAWLVDRTGQRRKGRRDAHREALEKQNERVEQGRDAVRDGRDGGSPADRLRNNDGRW